MEKNSFGDKVFLVGVYVFISIVTLCILYPLIYIVSSSFSSGNAIRTGQVILWPVEPTLTGYNLFFQNELMLTGYVNSFIYMILGTFISIMLTIFGAFALSKMALVGRTFLMFFFTFTMLFSGGLIPTYMVVKNLNMVDTIWALVIPGAINVWNLIIAITFFRTSLTNEILEAAEIDGSGNLQTLFRIVIPLSKPIIAVLSLFVAVGIWNSYFNALIYIRSQDLYPLQLVLREVLIQNSIKPSDFMNMERYLRLKNSIEIMKYSTIVVASIPALVIYPFVQRHFVKGVMIGSLKG